MATEADPSARFEKMYILQKAQSCKIIAQNVLGLGI